jgi:hypothetical protein
MPDEATHPTPPLSVSRRRGPKIVAVDRPEVVIIDHVAAT